MGEMHRSNLIDRRFVFSMTEIGGQDTVSILTDCLQQILMVLIWGIVLFKVKHDVFDSYMIYLYINFIVNFKN